MIIGGDLMVQLGLTSYFKRQVLHWDGATVHMKEPNGLFGKYYFKKELDARDGYSDCRNSFHKKSY